MSVRQTKTDNITESTFTLPLITCITVSVYVHAFTWTPLPALPFWRHPHAQTYLPTTYISLPNYLTIFMPRRLGPLHVCVLSRLDLHTPLTTFMPTKLPTVNCLYVYLLHGSSSWLPACLPDYLPQWPTLGLAPTSLTNVMPTCLPNTSLTNIMHVCLPPPLPLCTVVSLYLDTA